MCLWSEWSYQGWRRSKLSSAFCIETAHGWKKCVTHVPLMILDIWNSDIRTAVKKRIQEILVAKNTTELVIENRTWKKFRPVWDLNPWPLRYRMGFEPMTSAIPVQRSTNWTNKPTRSWSIFWVQINHLSDE